MNDKPLRNGLLATFDNSEDPSWRGIIVFNRSLPMLAREFMNVTTISFTLGILLILIPTAYLSRTSRIFIVVTVFNLLALRAFFHLRKQYAEMMNDCQSNFTLPPPPDISYATLFANPNAIKAKLLRAVPQMVFFVSVSLLLGTHYYGLFPYNVRTIFIVTQGIPLLFLVLILAKLAATSWAMAPSKRGAHSIALQRSTLLYNYGMLLSDYMLGEVMILSGNLDKAAQFLHVLLSRKRRGLLISNLPDPLTLTYYGKSLLLLGQTDDAIKVCEQARNTSPTYSNTIAHNLAWAYLTKNVQNDAALRLAHRCKSGILKTPANQALLAWALARNGNIEMSTQTENAALKLLPTRDVFSNAISYLYLASACMELGDEKKGADYIANAISADPNGVIATYIARKLGPSAHNSPT